MGAKRIAESQNRKISTPSLPSSSSPPCLGRFDPIYRAHSVIVRHCMMAWHSARDYSIGSALFFTAPSRWVPVEWGLCGSGLAGRIVAPLRLLPFCEAAHQTDDIASLDLVETATTATASLIAAANMEVKWWPSVVIGSGGGLVAVVVGQFDIIVLSLCIAQPPLGWPMNRPVKRISSGTVACRSSVPSDGASLEGVVSSP